jgi:orotate phosphoribosyltransferase
MQTPEFNAGRAAEETWEALLSAGAFVEGDFTLASGAKATLKVDAEKLYDHPRHFQTVLGHFAAHPCVQDADTLLYVPEGMREFTIALGKELDKPVAKMRHRPAAKNRYDFVFESLGDYSLAIAAGRPVICEDVVTTLGSVAAVRSLLTRPIQEVHSLAILRRGTVKEEYRAGLSDHYLVERHIPTDAKLFWQQLRQG